MPIDIMSPIQALEKTLVGSVAKKKSEEEFDKRIEKKINEKQSLSDIDKNAEIEIQNNAHKNELERLGKEQEGLTLRTNLVNAQKNLQNAKNRGLKYKSQSLEMAQTSQSRLQEEQEAITSNSMQRIRGEM